MKRITEEEVRNWWNTWPEANIAAITGSISCLVVLDLDAKHGRSSKEFQIPATACAKSGNGGEHFFFRHPGYPVKSSSAIFGHGVDIRADGGYILLSPSINVAGGRYEWIIPPEEDLAEMPDWLKRRTAAGEKKWLIGKDGVSTGSRNDTAASMAGKILSNTAPELCESLGWDQFWVWNSKNIPPLPERELRQVWDSIAGLHKQEAENKSLVRPEKVSQADRLVEIIEENKDVVLFHDEIRQPCIRIQIDDHFETWKCNSSQLKTWLSKVFWDKYKKAPNSDSINTALTVIKGKAGFEGDKIALFNRVGWHGEALWYDLADKDWRAVKITGAGWEIISRPSIIFRRYSHQEAQIAPEAGVNLKDILKYVNITDPDQQILFLVWIVSCFIPGFPHPVPYIYGPQGSAKSTISKIVRSLVDPSTLEVLSFPRNEVELVQILSHNWTVLFDNVSYISEDISDMLCKAVSGGGFSKRELYTDDDDIIYSFKRCIGINGINLMAIKPDLLERSILFELDRVSEAGRRQEKEILAEFETAKPGILFSIFETLSKAMRIKTDIKLLSLPRMADFTVWGCAIAEASGLGQETFLDAYKRNISGQNKEILYEDPVASLILDFMDDRDEWAGTATKLLEELRFMASEDVKRILPKAPNHLSRILNQLKTNLEIASIKISKDDGKKQRKIVIQKLVDVVTASEKLNAQLIPTNNDSNDKNDEFPNILGH